MPAPRTSPPLVRPGRSPGKRRSIQNFTPPVPMWDNTTATPPVPLTDKRDRHLYTPVQLSDPPRSPRLPQPLRAAYDVSSSTPRMRESPKPALMSPPIIAPISPSLMSRRQKLLPAIPIDIDSPGRTTPRSRRSVVPTPEAYGYGQGQAERERVLIVVNDTARDWEDCHGHRSPREVASPSARHRQSSSSSLRDPPSPAIRHRHSSSSLGRDPPSPAIRHKQPSTSSPGGIPSPALRHRQSAVSLSKQAHSQAQAQSPATAPGPTPPRPARRRRDSAVSPKQVDLAPPRPDFSRAASPSGDSVSTLSDAPTPRAAGRVLADETKPPSKRDSTQRRLDALRGLVANLDFNQPWSLTEEAGAGDWSPCSGLQETLVSPRRSIPLANAHINTQITPDFGAYPEKPPHSPYPAPTPSDRWVSQDHGWTSTPPRRPTPSSATPQQQQQCTPQPQQHTPVRARKELFKVASSGYSKCLEPSSPLGPLAPPTPEQTWRASLSSDAIYHGVLAKHGPDEVKRQEVIWEMCETEQTFLRSMRNVLRLFATPLKTPHGHWIDGIPDRISALFDALESVTHAHGVIAATVRDLRRKSEVVDINAFVRVYKGWVPKLEVYEGYLLRFEPVVALVEEHIRDPESVFGEFVRMQSKEEALGSMSLGSMLLKPVQRLMKYPLFFKRLLDATPCHPDLLSLLASTESIILTLQAAKAKEEDFDQLVQLESRLSGLPPDFVLAQRGRKLTGHGTVLRVHPNTFPGMMTSSRSSVSSTLSSISSPWDSVHSPSAGASRASSFSVSSVSSGVPSRAGSLRMSPSAFSLSPKRPSIHRSPSSASSTAGAGAGAGSDSSRPTTPSKRRAKDELALFVFDDLVILAAPNDKAGIFSSKVKKDRGWRVLAEHEGGMGKLVEVKDWSGFGGHAALFVLTILPLTSTHTREPLLPISICLTISPSSSGASPRGKPPLKCPQLTTLPQYLNALAQATTAIGSEHSVYCAGEDKDGEHDGEEVLYYSPDRHESRVGRGVDVSRHDAGDRVEIAFDSGDEHPLHSLRALGYAQ